MLLDNIRNLKKSIIINIICIYCIFLDMAVKAAGLCCSGGYLPGNPDTDQSQSPHDGGVSSLIGVALIGVTPMASVAARGRVVGGCAAS